MKLAKIMKTLLVCLMLCSMLVTTVACDKNKDDTSTTTTTGGGNTPPTPPAVTLSLSADKANLSKGDTAQINATVNGAVDNAAVTWTSADNSILTVSDTGLVTMVGDILIDTIVKITAVSKENIAVSAVKTFIAKAPVVDGQVGELTSDMIAAIGNESITVTGTLTDIYEDFLYPANDSTHTYEMTVEMAKDQWKGSWNVQGSRNVLINNYRKGEIDGLKDTNGNVGHALMEMYVNKNNTVSSRIVKNYQSIPTVWESQHLWNHLANLNVNRFTYDPENNRYKFKLDVNSVEELYLMTYLSISLTPMLEDTLDTLFFYVEDGKITRLVAQTEVLLYGDNVEEDPEAMSYTVIDVVFSKIGETVVADPETYEAPDEADLLTSAFAKMGAATNYTFRVNDRTTYMPVGDEGDYDIMSVGGAVNTTKYRASVAGHPYANTAGSTGSEGSVGFVTEDAIVIGVTGKYSYTMDGKNYHTEYSGYKQNNDGTYDEFLYSPSISAFRGTKKVSGNIFDVMPDFDVSANIFEFDYSRKDPNTGVRIYHYYLKNNAIARDVAMQFCAYSYADDATNSPSADFRVGVDENGNLTYVTFSYVIGSGMSGECTVNYSNVGTTVLKEGAMDGYVQRVPETAWNQYSLTDYYYLFSTQCKTYGCYSEEVEGKTVWHHLGHHAAADAVVSAIFGDQASNMPTPADLMEVFGDNINGPFFNWRETGSDTLGNPTYASYMSITTQSQDYDENRQINNYDEIIAELDSVLGALGFTKSYANTDTTGGASGRSNRYVTYIKDGVQIVVENNFTRYFWIYFYQTGDWTLSK